QVGSILLADPTTGHHDDPVAGASHQLGDQLATLPRATALARGENPLDPELHQLVEGREWIATSIDRTVKGDLGIGCGISDALHRDAIDVAAIVEGTEHHS